MQPGELQAPFDILAMFLPVLGLSLAFVTASLLGGSARRMAFAVGPFLVGCAMWWVGPAVTSNTGNWLASLFASVLYLCGYLAIGLHYHVLVVVAIGAWLRRDAELRKAANESTFAQQGPSTAGPG